MSFQVRNPTMEAPNLKPSVTTHPEVDPHDGIRNNQVRCLLENKQEGAAEQITFAREARIDVDDDEYERRRRYLDSLSPGYKFCPSDSVLVIHYLMRKIMNKRLPPNKILDVNIYRHNPEFLAANYQMTGDKVWYFFTPRDRKYRNGNRPNRAAGDGYWKATGADKQIKFKGQTIGCRKSLVFYHGRPPSGAKTNWIMHEFKEPPKPKKEGPNDMRLDEWVLCRIYKKRERAKKSKSELPENSSPELSDENDTAQMNYDYDNVGYSNETNGGAVQPSFYNETPSNDPCDGGLQPISSQPPPVFHNGVSSYNSNGISSTNTYGGHSHQPSFHNEISASLPCYQQLPASVDYGMTQPIGISTSFQYPSNRISNSGYFGSYQEEILSITKNDLPNLNNVEPFPDYINLANPSN